MPLIRTKHNVPQPYVAESRDFQLLTRVLDLVQNSVKFDIDSIVNIIDTRLISSSYLERLKSKLGFFTSKVYDDRTLRIVLSAFPHIIKYKGSEEGVKRCVNTYLNVSGISGGSRVDIYNKSGQYDHLVRIGISGGVQNIQILKDLLSYVLPSGYMLEIYTYAAADMAAVTGEFDSTIYRGIPTTASEFTVVRSTDLEGYEDVENETYNTAQLSTVYDYDAEL